MDTESPVLATWVSVTQNLARLMDTSACAPMQEKPFLKLHIIAEDQGFEVIHGIVDSLWLKKKNATIEEYQDVYAK